MKSWGWYVARGVTWTLALSVLAAHIQNTATTLIVESAASSHIHLSGDVGGLVPGRTAPLRVVISNDGPKPAALHQVTVSVTAPGDGPRCGASYVHVSPYVGPIQVPAHGKTVAALSIHLSRDMPETCAGVSWQLAYDAR